MSTGLSRAQWRKSTRSNGGEDSCVEVASLPGLWDDGSADDRDSKNPNATPPPSRPWKVR